MLVFRFDTFRQGFDAHSPGNGDHGSDDFPVDAVAIIKMLDQGHIEFDQIHVEAAENIEGGLPAAEIVKPELVAHVAHGAQLFLEIFGGGGHVLFGDFHDDITAGNQLIRTG